MKKEVNSKTRDLSGRQFGHLTVLKKMDGRSHSGDDMWLCQCTCGNQVQVSTGRLNSGGQTTCGDRYRHPTNHKYGDLTGRQFGHLTVLERIPVDDNHPKSLWLCECDCGKQIAVPASPLVKGIRTSCGHGFKTSERLNALEKAHYDKLFVDGVAVGLIDSNRKKVAKNSKTGVTGVSEVQRKNGPKYLAQIYVNHVRTRIGYFDTIEEAKEARLAAELKFLPKKIPTRGRRG
ncbi:HNH endonuclease [Lactobacillus phage phig1e]|uniref:HNH endonuclease n=1 Tax=Lactobacillus phage phig1e TaxID=52979 RepID=UPI000009BC9F|nr:HNH endonuclease [Lactobacillus phage phig1e]pir/T13226/ hypothetical protein R232 - Lactobacillus phage phi-gle [Lactobacillus phage phi-gle]CAA66755.1 Rorf232 [Lactobacillus phage phig1e]